jgi:hypothetical protein
MSSPIGITPVKPIPIINATAVIPIAIEMPILSAPRFFGADELEPPCEPESLGLSNPFGKAPSAIVT